MKEETLKILKELGFSEYWDYEGLREPVIGFACGKDGCKPLLKKDSPWKNSN